MNIELFRLALVLLIAMSGIPLLNSNAEDFSQETQRIRRIVLSRSEDPAAVAYLMQLTRNLSPSSTSKLYLQIAEDYLQQEKYDKAGELLRQLTDQFPEEQAAVTGCRKLVQLYSSSEVANTSSMGSGQSGKVSDQATYALYLANQIRGRSTKLRNDSWLLFQSAVAARLSGKSQLAVGYLTQLKHRADSRTWQKRALAESWLIGERKEEAPIAYHSCKRISIRPHLDGQLQDSCWESIPRSSLHIKERQREGISLVIFAWDEEFLYLAIRVKKQKDIKYLIDERPRSHDANLSDFDHVKISLDSDRDYATCYQLAIDHRGWTSDTCWHSSNWNPRWFVAAHQSEAFWNTEAAIPWSELGGLAEAGEAWAVSIQRVLPNAQYQDEDFELLLIE